MVDITADGALRLIAAAREAFPNNKQDFDGATAAFRFSALAIGGGHVIPLTDEKMSQWRAFEAKAGQLGYGTETLEAAGIIMPNTGRSLMNMAEWAFSLSALYAFAYPQTRNKTVSAVAL